MEIRKLLLMAGLHFVLMFFLMYSMIATWSHFYLNINKVYMAGIMTAPMLIIEILLMGAMYKNKLALKGILGSSLLALGLFFLFIRQQSFVDNEAFLQSMIPHHSSAILMCEQTSITDTEIAQLCDEIVKTQREEIEIMERMLREKY